MTWKMRLLIAVLSFFAAAPIAKYFVRLIDLPEFERGYIYGAALLTIYYGIILLTKVKDKNS